MKTAEMKSKFRQSKEWKNFRKQMHDLQKGIDVVTKAKLRKGAALHHCDLNPEHYKDLNPDNFVFVNSATHDAIHWAFTYYKKYGHQFIENFESVLLKMKQLIDC